MYRLLPGPSHPFFLLLYAVLIMPLIPAGLSDPLRVYCPFPANYSSNSTFQSNLNALLSSLSSLSSGGPVTGFFNDTRGAGPDLVYGLSLCRGDIRASRCHTCLNNAVEDITSRCQYGKTAAVWYDDCLLRYSDRRFFSSVDTSPNVTIPNPNNVPDPEQFGRSLEKLMDELTTTAAYHRPDRMYAAAGVALNGSRWLYGLVQCTRDLSGDQCSRCLKGFISFIPTSDCCGGKEGGRLFGLSCILRFELFPFVEAQDAVPLPPPAAELGPAGSFPPAAPAQEKKNRTPVIVLAVVLPTLAALVAAIASCIWMKRRKTIVDMLGGAEDSETRYDEPMSFDLKTLRTATNNFSYENKLGEGGFGPVHKGVLLNGQQIAIKRLSRSSRQGLQQLRNEMVLLAKLQHRNLVRLLGYCLEEDANLLVYEYLPNKSLDKFLFDPVKRRQLTWERRYKIIEGIARGLLYLHQDSRLRVIHRDLKASNILLDGEMNSKISDFGLAKLFGIEQSQGNTSQVAGTRGYMAPEYVIHGNYSKKSDIYSFGIVVLEIITGQQSIRCHGSDRVSTLTSYVWQHWIEETIIDALDQSMVEGCLMEQVLRCVHIGLLCVQDDPYHRPSIASVVLMLSSNVIELPTISEPAFCTLRSITTSSYSPTMDEGISLSGHERLNNEMSSH